MDEPLGTTNEAAFPSSTCWAGSGACQNVGLSGQLPTYCKGLHQRDAPLSGSSARVRWKEPLRDHAVPVADRPVALFCNDSPWTPCSPLCALPGPPGHPAARAVPSVTANLTARSAIWPELLEESGGGFPAARGDRMGCSRGLVPFHGGLDRLGRLYELPAPSQQLRQMHQDMALVECMAPLMVALWRIVAGALRCVPRPADHCRRRCGWRSERNEPALKSGSGRAFARRHF